MSRLLSVLGLFLPHFFAATLSRREATDRRLLKYFLPYGLMKKRMRYVFNTGVGDDGKDRGISGLFRWICPYGTVLWWDGGRDAVRTADSVRRPEAAKTPPPAERSIEALRREVTEGTERIEVLLLRLADSLGEKVRRDDDR